MNTLEFLNTPSQRKAVAVSTSLTGGTQAFAQGTALEEIIVTATKREAGRRWLECHPLWCKVLGWYQHQH